MTGAHELLAFLDLERIDGDIYRGLPGVWPEDRPHIYGGEVAAQALRAASYTVPEGRLPHSLHGYFLRRGVPGQPVLFVVDRDRDGRSFSARRVAAMQNGEVIWEMTCSFHEPEEGFEYAPARRPGVADPDDSELAPRQWCPLLEIRVPPDLPDMPTRPESLDRCWIRVVVPVADDPIIQLCLLAFTSDVASGFGSVLEPGIPPWGPSIDHAVWFHGLTRSDEWVLYDCSPLKVGGHRGLYRGSAHDLDGNLVAMITQEMLLRPPPTADAAS